MIRYYAYYSCGGYKDMYLGNSSDSVAFTYFLPLLRIWKTGKKKEYSKKLEQVKDLQLIEIVTQINDFDFPKQAKTFFSHGGYKVVYQTLGNGDTCLCVRDITNDAKDEENRDIPFNVLITASGEEDIKKLDAFALHSMAHIVDTYEAFSHLFTYDPIINGIKYNLDLANDLIKKVPLPQKQLQHENNRIVFLVVDVLSMAQKAFDELDISRSQVDFITDNSGNSKGALKYQIQSTCIDKKIEQESNKYVENTDCQSCETVEPDTPPKIANDSSTNQPTLANVVSNREKETDVNQHKDECFNELKTIVLTLQDSLSSNISSIEEIKTFVSNSRHEDVLNKILLEIEKFQGTHNNQSLNTTKAEIDNNTITLPNAQLLRICISFIIGILLGAIIF